MAITTPAVGSTGWDVQMGQVIDRVNELESVDATSDADKPVSTATQAALDDKADADDLIAHTSNTSNPHAVTKTQVGLGSVDNVSAANLRDRSTHTGSQAQSTITNLTTDLAAKAPVASPTFTGTATAPRLITPPVDLTDASTIAVDASLGNHFRVTLGGNRTLGAPTNPTNGQKILIEVVQDGTGSRTLAYDSAYAFGTDVPSPTLTTTASKRDFIGFVYNSTATKWYALGVSKGY